MPDGGQTNRGSFSVDKSDAPTLDPRRRLGWDARDTREVREPQWINRV